jgi:hypothetical protein
MKTKGKNFSSEEALQLCRSYLSISKDSTKGTNQKASTFYERITDHFNANKPAESELRKIRSVETKWLSISKACGKFSDARAAVKDLRRSGASVEDELDDALRVYQVTNGEEFKFLHCWQLLKTEPKWRDLRTPKTPSIRASDVPDPNGNSTAESAPRSTGVKSAKAAQNAAAVEEVTLKKLAEATAKMASSSLKRARALEEANHLALFATSLDALDPDAREYFSMRRAAVLTAMRESMREHRATAPTHLEDKENSVDTSNNADDTTEPLGRSNRMETTNE